VAMSVLLTVAVVIVDVQYTVRAPAVDLRPTVSREP